MSTIPHILKHLASTIGPRPVGSDTERTAAEWIASEFRGMGLPTEIQDFEANRTTTWSNFLYFFIAILSVVIIGLAKNGSFWSWFFFIALFLVTIGFYLELNGGQGLGRILTKGPSQNVIARYSPRSRPGDARRKKVVIVARYDTLRCSPLTENALAPTYAVLQRVCKYLFGVLTLLALAMTLPFGFLRTAHTVLFYIGLVACVVPFLLMLDLLLRGTMKRFSPGANNNASGVAALLTAASELIDGKPDLDESLKQHTHASRAVSDAFFGKQETGALWMPSDEALDEGGVQDLPDDFSWAPARGGEATDSASASSSVGASPSAIPTKREASEADFMRYATMDIGNIPEEAVSQPTVSFAPVADDRDLLSESDPNEILGPDLIGEVAPRERFQGFERRASLLERLRGGSKRKKSRHLRENDAEPDSWFGLDESFNAREEGKKIGSWDNFGEDPDDDGFAWKGGAAGGDVFEDNNFASESASRIRKKFTSSQSMIGLDEKELWFVATGAFGVHGAGMKRLLAEYGADLRDAFIINIESVGAGQLRWYATEGAGKEYSANVRMTSLARRASRQLGIKAKSSHVKGIATDASVALREGLRAITITRLEKNGMPANWRSMNDTVEDVDLELVAEAARFVAGMAREA